MVMPRVLPGVQVAESEIFPVATLYKLEKHRAQIKICTARIVYRKLSIRIALKSCFALTSYSFHLLSIDLYMGDKSVEKLN